MEAEGRQLQKEVNEYQMLLEALTKAEEQEKKFREELEQSAKETADAKTALERSRVMLESLEGSKDYQNQQGSTGGVYQKQISPKRKKMYLSCGQRRDCKKHRNRKTGHRP